MRNSRGVLREGNDTIYPQASLLFSEPATHTADAKPGRALWCQQPATSIGSATSRLAILKEDALSDSYGERIVFLANSLQLKVFPRL